MYIMHYCKNYMQLGNSEAENTHRVAAFDDELCQPKKCGLECIVYCPVNKTGGECIIAPDGKALIAKIYAQDVACIKKCPFDAIVIVNLAKELSEDKVHQYGVNSFRFYRLPTPKKGAVVGLVGRNSMGKSTIVNILSGNMKPNLGKYDQEISWDEILKYYQGTEMKSHFEKIANGAMRFNQTAAGLPHTKGIQRDAKGTVEEI